ncbi:MAG: PilT/PilU family type 4a pilus ATPase [Patescibacteria group bacterium]|jgi:twitching motility protein PilT
MDTQNKLAIDNILNTVAGQKASDLHLSVGSPPIIRIDNKLIPLENENIISKDFMETFIDSLLDNDQKNTLQENREIVLTYQFGKQERFRINLFFQKGALAAYLRLISNQIVPLNQLGLPLQPLIKLASLNKGLLLVSGAFGSGKSTTSSSIIDYINKNASTYILSIEKPIEHIFTGQKSFIEQREVGRDAVSFEQALSNLTQEDVNIVYVSDLPSSKVIEQVLKISSSGRLVIADIEADTVVKTLKTIIDSFPSNEQQQIKDQLSTNLEGIICQKLVPRTGGGQVAVAEIMTSTPPIRSLIKEGSLYQLNNIIQTSREEGMVSLDWSLAELVKSNQVQIDDALEYAIDPQQLSYMLRA